MQHFNITPNANTIQEDHYARHAGLEHSELESGPMPNVMAALPNIGGAVCSLKFAGVPQTRQQISAVIGRSLPYYKDIWMRYCSLTSFFRLSIHALVEKIQPDKVVRWCRDDDFLRPVFQRAACSRFQTCILNSH